MYQNYWDIMTYSGEMSLIRWTSDHYVSILLGLGSVTMRHPTVKWEGNVNYE